jgi:hypothetical protein
MAEKDPVSLSFVDLLYAVPVADIATRVGATHLRGISAAGWSALALSLALITFGWIGHHNNRRRLPRKRAGEFRFFSPRFVQFTVEVLIIGAYFALGTRLGLSAAEPSATWQAAWLVVAFSLYLTWDGLDVYVANRPPENTKWAQSARKGGLVTAVFLLVFGGLLAVVCIEDDHASGWVVGVNLIAIGVLYAYRAIQEHIVEPKRGVASPGG